MGIDLSSGAEIGRLDKHSPVNFLPENYSFVGCFHNTYVFNGRQDQVREEMLRRLASNPRPHGPGCSNCDHCGAAIAFVGVFQHTDGEYIAVGSTCAENRFPMSNVEFQTLRKAHRLSSAARRAEAKFEEFQAQHPEVDWVAAKASTDRYVVRIMANGRKYGSLYAYNVQMLQRALAHVAQVAAQPAPAAPAPASPEQAFLRAYNGNNGFLNSLKDQAVVQGRTLSPRQLDCLRQNMARDARQADPAAQAKAQANQQLVPGIYVATDGTIWKVQGNMAYKSAAKRAVQQKVPFDPSTVSGARTYAKVWVAGEAPLPLAEVNDLSTVQHWSYEAAKARGGLANLTVDHKMTVDEAKHFGTLYSQCVWCGKTLEVTESIERGIGPVCIKYLDATVITHELDHSHN